MKKCTCCGRENNDDAARCLECGTKFAASAPASEAPGPWERIAVLAHAVEADRVDVELNNRQIPHVMVSYGDSMLDGIYQTSHGWGHVEAPVEHKEAVLSAIEDVRRSGPEPEADAEGAP